jgi:hypothetical protein
MEKRKYMIMINVNQSLNEDLLECLKSNGIKFHTLIESTRGVGSNSEPHLGTPVWPEMNNTYFIGVSEEQKKVLLQELHSLKEKWKNSGVNWFCWKLEIE